jgi:hypothetical protein
MVGLVLREHVANLARIRGWLSRAFSPERPAKPASPPGLPELSGYQAAGRDRRASRRLASLASLSPRSTSLQPVRARSDGRVCCSGESESWAHVCCMIRKACWRNSARQMSASSERALSTLTTGPPTPPANATLPAACYRHAFIVQAASLTVLPVVLPTIRGARRSAGAPRHV